jgi:hypothetical protein
VAKVKVRLGAFAAEALARKLGNGGVPGSPDFERVIQFYLAERSAKPPPGWAYPDFLRERRASDDVELDLKIEDPLWASLEAEAREQDVVVDRLLEHAMLYFAAEMDAGRTTERILEDLGKEEEPEGS